MTMLVSTVPKSRFDFYHVSFPEGWEVRFLDMPCPEPDFIETCREADFLFVGSGHAVSAKLIESCPRLRMIQTESASFNKIDLQAAAEAGLPVCNNQSPNAAAVAEFTVGLMLAALRRMAVTDEWIKAGRFEECQKSYRARGASEMRSRRVGLIGCGVIGRRVAELLRAFGCGLFYFDERRLTPKTEKELGLTWLPLKKLLGQCDVISLHVPTTPRAANLISGPEMELMTPEALIINTSGGEALDQAALAEALEAGRIYGAAIDTLSPEPPPADHPLLSLSPAARDRLLVSPHVAGATDEAFGAMLKRALANMERALAGDEPHHAVGGLSWPRAWRLDF